MFHRSAAMVNALSATVPKMTQIGEGTMRIEVFLCVARIWRVGSRGQNENEAGVTSRGEYEA